MSEPCKTCGAAMADDQRYCLNCGERRGGPRVDFRQHLPAAKAEGPAQPPNGVALPPLPEQTAVKPPEGERRQRDYAPLAAAGGIAVLGIMLLIGVLIGRGTGDGGTASSQPQVVTVAAEGTSKDGGEDAGGEGEAATADKQGRAAGKQKAKQQGKASTGGSGDTGNAPVSSANDLQQMQEQSPEQYSESSAKLPDEIATEGAPPPTDNKAPGGGSGGTTIE